MKLRQLTKTSASVLLLASVISSLAVVPTVDAATKKKTPPPTGSIKIISGVKVPGKTKPLPRGNVYVQISTTNLKADCKDPDTKIAKSKSADGKTLIFSAKTNAKKSAGKNLGTFKINSCTANTKYTVALKLNENKAYQKVSIKPASFTLKKSSTIKYPKPVTVVIKRVTPTATEAPATPAAPAVPDPSSADDGSSTGQQNTDTIPAVCNDEDPAYNQEACDALPPTD